MSNPPALSTVQAARTAVAQAQAATLWTRTCPRAQESSTIVRLTDQADGHPFFHLLDSSPARRTISRHRVVTTVVPGLTDESTVSLTGMARVVAAQSEGLLTFRLQPLSVRLTHAEGGQQSVPLHAYLEADPEPLWHIAGRALDHLEHAHQGELIGCVRGHGFPATAVVPSRLDRHGMQLVALSESGVETVDLPFAGGPVRSIHEVNLSLRTLLACRCGHGQQHRVTTDPPS